MLDAADPAARVESAAANGCAIPALAPREDFPILQRQLNGHQLVYLDSAATTQKPLPVLQAMDRIYHETNANIHRGAYTLSEETTRAYEGARRKIAHFINARATREIIYTRNATEAVNLVARTWGEANLHAGDVILTTEMEHHSNIVPWHLLASRTGARVEFVPITDDGEFDLAAYARLLETTHPKLVTMSYMSNVLGTQPPTAAMIAQAHAAGALVLLDAAQAVPHLPVDVRALECDFLAFSGHKMLGPTGIGVLWGRTELLEAMPPFLGGGDMIREVHLAGSTWNDLPWKFEAGTPAYVEAVGLGAAVDYLTALDMHRVHQHERQLVAYAMERLAAIPDLTIYGPPPDRRGGVISFTLGDIHPHDLATLLDREGVCIRAGHHCAQPLMERYRLPATARASFYVYSTSDEVDALVAALEHARTIFAF
jgi:cysteine desulfurase/selenocysteine lyase